MKPALVVDANVWIDLENAGLLTKVLEIPFSCVTSDMVLEELSQGTQQHLANSPLRIHNVSPEMNIRIQGIRATTSALSYADLSVLLLAGTLNCILVTGERRLTNEARA
ncbi:MAG: hypothetical protein J7M19_03070 [Planctomycetes bacterium]|nr:hypothetical protein [Planctomycetota bacterium]